MLKIQFGAQEAITIILTSAMSVGGFYLLTYVMSVLIMSPIALLIGLLVLNILNIWYHLSPLYTKVFEWTYNIVGKALNKISESRTCQKIARFVIRTKNTIKEKLEVFTDPFKCLRQPKTNVQQTIII